MLLLVVVVVDVVVVVVGGGVVGVAAVRRCWPVFVSAGPTLIVVGRCLPSLVGDIHGLVW